MGLWTLWSTLDIEWCSDSRKAVWRPVPRAPLLTHYWPPAYSLRGETYAWCEFEAIEKTGTQATIQILKTTGRKYLSLHSRHLIYLLHTEKQGFLKTNNKRKMTQEWAMPINRQFSSRTQRASKYTKRCSTSLEIGEIQMKMTQHLYPLF